MSHPSLVLTGQSPELAGLNWKSDTRLRIGRLSSDVDVVVNDGTISPHHAEIVFTRNGWVVRDLGSRNGTFVNGERINGKQQNLRDNDRLGFGRLQFSVGLQAAIVAEPVSEPLPPMAAFVAPQPPPADEGGRSIRTSGTFLRVQATAHHSWEQAIDVVSPGDTRSPWQDKHIRALLRAGYSVCKVSSPDDLLQSILTDAVSVLEAQRGAILLADDQTGHLHLRALSLSRHTLRNKGTHSHTLAERCFSSGESVLCADVQSENEIQSVTSVAHGAMTSIICALLRTSRGRLGVLHLDRGPLQLPFTREEFHLADAMAATVSVGIESAQLFEKQRQQFVQTVAALGRAVEIRDLYTANHTNRVTAYSLLLAHELKVSPQELSQLQIGTPLHDIGKIGIEDAILRKPDRLTAEEFAEMKTHTVKGAAILETIPALQPVVPIARHHHERWDGHGYPDGLAQDQISRVARIVAVADAFDAMTSDRPYRRALPLDVAFSELVKKAGAHFDPACANAFVAQRAKVEAIWRSEQALVPGLEALTSTLIGR